MGHDFVLPFDDVPGSWLPAAPNYLVLALVALAGCYGYSKRQPLGLAPTLPVSAAPAPPRTPWTPNQ